MNLSALFIRRPVATTLMTIGIVLSGLFAYAKLPVSPLPQVDFPTISVNASLPGASPDTVATSVASPLERHLGQIADVTEMTSSSSVGQTRIILQFGLDRDINGAARDVEAAINAARADLPTSLRSNPTYRKVNPADAPILILALTSKTMTRGQMYQAASNVLEQRLSQIDGIGQVIIGGAAMPAVRVDLNPLALSKYGIGLEDVRAALASANANSPKGSIAEGNKNYQIYTNDQSLDAADYKPLIIAYRNGDAVTLSDIADVTDGVENIRNAGLSNGQPAVLVILFRQPGANIIDTVDAVKAALPELEAAMPADIHVTIANDRTPTIRASLNDTQRTLLIAVALVTAVVFVFLRDWRATLIPAVAVPVSIIGTFGTMYLLGYSLDNLSLMALTISTGFVVDDAIVVLENIARHIEAGMPRRQAALLGAKEVGFTVLTISLSLIAVFIPILLMGGIVGRLFREFAVTLSMAILVSLVISLTTTPMMCALLLRRRGGSIEAMTKPGVFDRVLAFYGRTLNWALRHSALVLMILAATVAVNVALLVIIPKGFFPDRGHGPADRRDASGSGRVLPGDGKEARADDDDRAARSGGTERGGLHGARQRGCWRAGEHRLGVHRTEAIRTAPGDRAGDGPAAAGAVACAGRAAVPAARAGHPGRRTAEQCGVSVHATGRQLGGAVPVGAEAGGRAGKEPRAAGRKLRPAAEGAGDGFDGKSRRGRAARFDDEPGGQHAV